LPNPTEHRTEDLAFAAFLRVKGYPLIRVEKLQPNRTDSKRAFIFELPEAELQALKLAFVNSDLLRFYNELLGLKKL
jgi:hypothetical protein